MNPDSIPQTLKPRGVEGAFPRVTVTITGLCGVAWLVAVTTQGNQAWMILRPTPFEFRGLIAHAFYHENGIHILLNIGAILYAGHALEIRWGALRFLAFYSAAVFMSGVASVLVALALTPDGNGLPRGMVTFGASGAALACLTAYTLVVEDRPLAGSRFLTERSFFWAGMILGSSGLLLLQEIARARDTGFQLNLLPQISGIAAGAALYYCFRQWDRSCLKKEGKLRAAEKKKSLNMQLRVDQLLEKIHHHGLESLSEEERSFLQHASKRYGSRN